jgi:SAM-dependent methyltransferase
MDFKIFILIFNIILFLFILGGFYGVIWTPTKKRDFDRIAKLMDLKPGMTLYDLGSGTGDLLFHFSKRYNIKCVGIEVSPVLYLYSKFNSLFFKNVEIKYGDFFKNDLSEADVIYAFLHPKMYGRLKEKIVREVKKDSTVIVLSTWPFKNLKPSKLSQKNRDTTYFLYKKADFQSQLLKN